MAKRRKNIYQLWLAYGLAKPNKTTAGLARQLKIHESAIFKMISGERTIFADELATISYYIEEPQPRVGYGTGNKMKPTKDHR